jgi:hypothetical protein
MAEQSGPPLTAWATRLLAALDAADRRAAALAAGLTPSQLNWQPAPASWSIGQCLDHLRLTNEVYLQAISAALPPQPDHAVQEITPGRFSRWFIRSFVDESTSQSKRAHAPKKIVPASAVDSHILDLFLASNQPTRDLIHRAAAYDVNSIRFKNPFIPLVRFTVGTGLEAATRHQGRHLLQAERVKQSPEFPTS